MLKAEDPSGERPLWHSPMWQKGLSQELKGLRQPANKRKWRATTELLKSALRQKDPIRLLRRMALSSRATDLEESVKENEQWTNVKSQEKLIIQDNLKKDLGEQRAESAERPWNLAATKLQEQAGRKNPYPGYGKREADLKPIKDIQGMVAKWSPPTREELHRHGRNLRWKSEEKRSSTLTKEH